MYACQTTLHINRCSPIIIQTGTPLDLLNYQRLSIKLS